MTKNLLISALAIAALGGLAWMGVQWRMESIREQMELFGQSVPLDPREVHFVPTPPPVAEKMLELAELAAGDVVLDLGCGDGRLVIGAAKQFGCRGRGYDIDPELIEECKRNAMQAGVQDLVEFHVQDIYELDISDATVLLLYLLPEMNLRLLPQMQTMADNARVVTHDFEVPGVGIEREVRVEDKTGPKHMHMTHRVFLYRAPLLLDPHYEPSSKVFEKALQYVLDRNVRMADEDSTAADADGP